MQTAQVLEKTCKKCRWKCTEICCQNYYKQPVFKEIPMILMQKAMNKNCFYPENAPICKCSGRQGVKMEICKKPFKLCNCAHLCTSEKNAPLKLLTITYRIYNGDKVKHLEVCMEKIKEQASVKRFRKRRCCK